MIHMCNLPCSMFMHFQCSCVVCRVVCLVCLTIQYIAIANLNVKGHSNFFFTVPVLFSSYPLVAHNIWYFS